MIVAMRVAVDKHGRSNKGKHGWSDASRLVQVRWWWLACTVDQLTRRSIYYTHT